MGEAPLAPHVPKRDLRSLMWPGTSAEVDEMHDKLKERKNNIDAINDKIRQMQSGGNRNPDNHLYDRLKKLRTGLGRGTGEPSSPFPPLGLEL